MTCYAAMKGSVAECLLNMTYAFSIPTIRKSQTSKLAMILGVFWLEYGFSDIPPKPTIIK